MAFQYILYVVAALLRAIKLVEEQPAYPVQEMGMG